MFDKKKQKELDIYITQNQKLIKEKELMERKLNDL